ncbi:DUF2782 domain-containing protein [Dyella subtropica]|uniref:DUF2782 domain-containing protein n=1 Tax=Dyella subtropica TaxID=2992127 RepID=UPI002253AD5C|nr:DUF2782 domain-containing protein [Dyella subtropica]
MKPVVLLVALGAFAALPVFAQSAQSLPPAPPPPGMNDPGVKAVEPPATQKPAKSASSQASGAAVNSKVPPTLPAMQDKGEPRDAHGEPPPQVTVRKQGDETIQEFRRSGMLYMVVVTPKVGVPQTYLVDANGNYHNQAGHEPVKPVMYKVMEWGKSKPAEAESAGGDGK